MIARRGQRRDFVCEPKGWELPVNIEQNFEKSAVWTLLVYVADNGVAAKWMHSSIWIEFSADLGRETGRAVGDGRGSG